LIASKFSCTDNTVIDFYGLFNIQSVDDKTSKWHLTTRANETEIENGTPPHQHPTPKVIVEVSSHPSLLLSTGWVWVLHQNLDLIATTVVTSIIITTIIVIVIIIIIPTTTITAMTNPKRRLNPNQVPTANNQSPPDTLSLKNTTVRNPIAPQASGT
jgi:hypothetical protein